MMDFALHIQSSLEEIAMRSNGMCKSFTVPVMKETARRLLAVGLAKGEKNFTAIAKALGASDQSATNWKARGVPKATIIKAATVWGVDPGWLAGEPNATQPECVSGWLNGESRKPGLRVAERLAGYGMTLEEQRLVDGFRVADQSSRRSMLLLTDDALARFGKRRENHK